MIEYLLWLAFAALGFGGGWLVWGRGAKPPPIQSPKQSRTIQRPVKGAVTAHAGPSAFRVVLLDGEVVYDGDSGGDARRHIERLRTQDDEWRAYRDGVFWDSGPKERVE